MATMADCAGCGKKAATFSSGSEDAVGSFDGLVASTWMSRIYVPQNLPASLKNLEVRAAARR